MRTRHRSLPILNWQNRIIHFTAAGVALVAGISYLINPIDYMPLFIGGVILCVVILIICLKHPNLALCFTLFVVFLPDGLLPANIQSNLNRTFTIGTFGIWFLYYFRSRLRIVLTPTAIFMIGFLLWSTITIFWAQNIEISLHFLQRYALRFLLFLFLLPNMIRSKKDLNDLMGTLAFSGWVMAFVSFYGILTTGYSSGSRLRVLGENENALGIGLMIFLLGFLWLALDERSRYQKILTILSYPYLMIIIFIIALSGSRGSAISLVVILFLLFLWKPTRLWGSLGLIVIVLGLLAVPIAFSTTLDRFAVTAGDTLLGGREAIWQATWQIIKRQPWTGVGIGNAPISVTPIVRFLRSIGDESTSIHNPVLAILAETGIPGILLYLSVLGSAVWVFLKFYLHNKNVDSQAIKKIFPPLAALFIGFMFSWIKAGGGESNHTYFFVLSLLLIPSSLETSANTN